MYGFCGGGGGGLGVTTSLLDHRFFFVLRPWPCGLVCMACLWPWPWPFFPFRDELPREHVHSMWSTRRDAPPFRFVAVFLRGALRNSQPYGWTGLEVVEWSVLSTNCTQYTQYTQYT